MSFHWYFTSALPRSLLIAYPLSWMAPFVERRIRPVALIALVYVLLYSKLNHKEVPHHLVACVFRTVLFRSDFCFPFCRFSIFQRQLLSFDAGETETRALSGKASFSLRSLGISFLMLQPF